MTEAGKCAAKLCRNSGKGFGETSDMQFVNDRAVPGDVQHRRRGPVSRVNDHGFGNFGAIAGYAVQAQSVRVNKKPFRVEPVALIRCVWTISPQAVERAFADIGDEAVEYRAGPPDELDAGEFRHRVFIEQAKIDGRSRCGKHRDIHAALNKGYTQWVRNAYV